MPIYLLCCVCYHVHCKLSEIKITTTISNVVGPEMKMRKVDDFQLISETIGTLLQ